MFSGVKIAIFAPEGPQKGGFRGEHPSRLPRGVTSPCARRMVARELAVAPPPATTATATSCEADSAASEARLEDPRGSIFTPLRPYLVTTTPASRVLPPALAVLLPASVVLPPARRFRHVNIVTKT